MERVGLRHLFTSPRVPVTITTAEEQPPQRSLAKGSPQPAPTPAFTADPTALDPQPPDRAENLGLQIERNYMPGGRGGPCLHTQGPPAWDLLEGRRRLLAPSQPGRIPMGAWLSVPTLCPAEPGLGAWLHDCGIHIPPCHFLAMTHRQVPPSDNGNNEGTHPPPEPSQLPERKFCFLTIFREGN